MIGCIPPDLACEYPSAAPWILQAANDCIKPGLVTAAQVSVFQQMLKSASGGQSGVLLTQAAINFASHGPASVPSKSRIRYAIRS